MAQVQMMMHWRDRAIEKAETISDAWQVFLAYTGRAAEIILFVCMVFSLLQMLPTITLWSWLINTILVVQMVTLDVAGFGLNSMAKAVRRGGDTATAEKAEQTATFLIIIMIVSLLSVTIAQMFGKKYPVVGDVMHYLDYGLILTRVVMTVLYGKVIHSLRESKQDIQIQADTTVSDLRADLTKARNEQKRLEKALTDEQEASKKNIEQLEASQEQAMSDLQEQLDGAKAENKQLAQKLSQMQTTLQDALQNGSSVQVTMQKVIAEKNENDSQIQNLQNQLSLAKTDLQSRIAELSQARNLLAVKAQNESSMQAKIEGLQAEMKAQIDEAVKATELAVKAQMQVEIEELRRANRQLKEQMKAPGKTPIKPAKQVLSEKFDTRSFVFACLQKNPEMKLSEIVSLAKMQGQELSEPTISRYRKEYRESSSESSAIM
jgi:hypothetical protein